LDMKTAFKRPYLFLLCKHKAVVMLFDVQCSYYLYSLVTKLLTLFSHPYLRD
jgi:hypothetical protein